MATNRLLSRLRHLSSRQTTPVAPEIAEEVRAIIAERVDHLMATGMSEADAHAEAMRRFGFSPEETLALLHNAVVTEARRVRTRETFSDFTQDVRYAVRTLRRDVGFTAFALFIIAVGIGASVTVFSVANTLLVRPLPFQDPAQLVWMPNTGGTIDSGESLRTTQVGHVLDFTQQNRSFAIIGAYNAFYGIGDIALSGDNDAIRVSAVQVSQSFFPALGVQPIAGRNFTDDECRWRAPKTVLLSYAFWIRRFASDHSIVGQTITLNGLSAHIIGVLPASFDFGSVFAPGTHIDLFSPFPLTPETNRNGNTLAVVGRLKPGVSLASASSEARVLSHQIARAHPERNDFSPRLMLLRDHVSGSVRTSLIMLVFAVGVVMLIVCANLSNLLLARAATRQREMAIRAALGAGRRRLVRQMLTESLLLSACGAAFGLWFAFVSTRTIAHMDTIHLPLLAAVHIDLNALAFAVALATAAGIVFGLAPALQIPETMVHDTLKVSGRGTTDGPRGRWMRRALVVSEIALACVLLVGSGLLIRSFLNVVDIDMGFRPDLVAAVRVDPSRDYLRSQATFIAYVDDVLRLTKSVPGVESAGLADGLPLRNNRSWGVKVAGRTYSKEQPPPEAFVRMVTDGYVSAMSMHLVEGRDFSPQDTTPGEPVIVLNQTAAKTLWPGESAIDKLFTSDRPRRVVGVVADVRHLSPEENSGLEMYIPLRQTDDFSAVSLVVRSTLSSAQLAPSLRTALAPVSPNLPINELRTLRQVVDDTVSPRRFFTVLLCGFAAFSLCLALLGIYSVISYTVNQRTQEIGVRMALGASPGQIQGRVIRETFNLAIFGMLIGTTGSWLLAHALRGMLFGVNATDAVTFISMLGIVAMVAMLSGYLPARRASRIDPSVAFRSS